jgi:hypothetical protein
MRTRFLLALLAAGAMTPAAAMAQNAVIVGGSSGGTVGVAVEAPPPPVVTYVERGDIPSVAVEEHMVVGQPLPATVELHTIPKYKKYSYAIVNDQRVIVDPGTRNVIKIID